jgi:hypothetical protein
MKKPLFMYTHPLTYALARCLYALAAWLLQRRASAPSPSTALPPMLRNTTPVASVADVQAIAVLLRDMPELQPIMRMWLRDTRVAPDTLDILVTLLLAPDQIAPLKAQLAMRAASLQQRNAPRPSREEW